MNSRERFLKACAGEKVDRPPVWLMRQAGRYLPEYQETKGKSSFLDMCINPDVAVEVTTQPLRRYDMDAAIIFSDILIIPRAMGMDLDYPGTGPTLAPPIAEDPNLDRLKPTDAPTDYPWLGEALERMAEQLAGEKALLGFAGAPFTLACYMIEGKGGKNFSPVKQFIYHNLETYHKLADMLADAIIDLLKFQISKGADAVQLFDTWAGMLGGDEYETLAAPYNKKIFAALKETGKSTILYVKGVAGKLDKISETGSDIVSLDWLIDIDKAREFLGDRPVQGNLDPSLLFIPPAEIKKRVRAIYEKSGGAGYIANLGHGILPGTPVEGVGAFVEAIKEISE